MKSQEFCVNIILFSFSLLMIFWIIPPHTGNPMDVGLSGDTYPTFLCAVILLISGLQIGKGLRQGISTKGEKPFTLEVVLHIVKYFGLMFLIFPAWQYLGFILGSAVVLAMLLWVSGERKLIAICVTTICVPVVVYCLITYGLNVPVPYL